MSSKIEIVKAHYHAGVLFSPGTRIDREVCGMSAEEADALIRQGRARRVEEQASPGGDERNGIDPVADTNPAPAAMAEPQHPTTTPPQAEEI